MTMLNMSRGPLWLLGGLLVVIAGCGGQGFVSPTFLKITVTPSTLEIGDTAVLHAVAHLSDGTTQDVTVGTQWSISDASLAMLAGGTITAKAAGSVTVQATYGSAPPAAEAVSTVLGNLNSLAKVSIAATVTKKVKPVITWANPAAIRYGTPINSKQLNATAPVPGTFQYTPAAGTSLRAGTRTLGVIFTPQDTTHYVIAYKVVPIQVNQVIPTIIWPSPAGIQQGAALSGTQLDATSNVFGTFTYHPGAGTVLPAGTQKLTVSFSPNDTTDYAAMTGSNSISVTGTSSTVTPPTSCGGPTVNLNSSMSTSQIQNAIGGAADCSLIFFAAGTYNITSSIFIPCPTSGLTIAGPAVAWPGPYQVTLNGSVLGGWGFGFGSCSSPVTIEYLNWNGGQPPSGGGGFLYVAPATNNLTVRYNFLHGNQANITYGQEFDSLIWIDGVDSDPPSRYDNNDTIEWNIFGSTNDGTAANADCGAISGLFTYQGDTYDAVGGYCAAIALVSSTNNFTVANNVIQYQEEGFKLYEGGSATNQQFYESSLNFTYNDIGWIHRISVEGQQTGNPGMNFNNNDIHDQVNPAWGSWGISIPQSGANNCNNNILMANYVRPGNTTAGPGSVEFWGNGSCSNNLVQGYWAAGMQYGFGGAPWSMDNNIIQQLADFSYINNEESITCCFPEITGNVESQQLAAVTSAAPTISPNPVGSYSAPVTVTLTDTGSTNGGIGPQGNTTIYYTVDGSTPTTSSAVCNPTPGSTSCSFQVGAGTTVKAIGMWGSINQPKSYPAGYGFVPSGVVSASYKAAVVTRPGARISSKLSLAPASAGETAAPSLISVLIAPSQASVNIGGTTQLKAVASFSDGSTKDVTTEFDWTSSDLRTIVVSSSGLLSGLATGKAQLSGSYRGQPASVMASSSVGQVSWSAPLVITRGGTYSGNWQSTNGKTPAVTIATQEPVVIQDSHVSSTGNLIQVEVTGADVTIRNSLGVALNPSAKGQSTGVFLDVAAPRRLDVENNYLEDVRDGVVVRGYSGDRSVQQTLVIRGNRVRNLNGLLSDGAGGQELSRFLALDNVQSVPGMDVGWNEVIDYPARSLVSDVISVYRSSGTANQPLQVHDTYIQDAHHGGGIQTEGATDDTVQNTSAYIDVHDNQVVGTVTYGIAFNAGHDNTAANNRVISTGMPGDGTITAAQQAALRNANVHGGVLYNNTMRDNLVGWACRSDSCAAALFLPMSPGDYSSNAVMPTKLVDRNKEDNEYLLWLNKTASAGIKVGPTF